MILLKYTNFPRGFLAQLPGSVGEEQKNRGGLPGFVAVVQRVKSVATAKYMAK
jgi:hypothetical protein